MRSADPSLLHEESPLEELTRNIRKNKSITWYRSPLTAAQMKELHRKSDGKATGQTLGYLGILVTFGALAYYSSGRWPWPVTVLLVFALGVCSSFHINAVHELGHMTVFQTRGLNVFFCRVFGFLGWINPHVFQSSHTRHHRYTLHPPDDLEVVLPVRIVLWHFVRDGFVNLNGLRHAILLHGRLAGGRFRGEWELTLYPGTAPEKRRDAIWLSRLTLGGHALIFLGSALTGQWMVFVLVSLAPFLGNVLHMLCNNTQHVGLQDHVNDFRLCSRTFLLNPVVRFLYWQMNYHIEHHMYAAVPCYNLAKLHKIIASDLPPTPNGLFAVWKEILAILRRQEKEPDYQHVVQLPASRVPSASGCPVGTGASPGR
jgi:fatty acid desaturase